VHAGASVLPELRRQLRFVIYVAGYLPQPITAFLPPRSPLVSPHLSDDGDPQLLPCSIRLPSFHVYGASDDIVPPAASAALAAAFCSHRSVHQHAGRHVVPQSAHDTESLVAFLTAMGEARQALSASSAALSSAAAPAQAAAALPTSVAAHAPWEEVPEDVLEEVDALQAIYDAELRVIHANPPAFTIYLRDPGNGGQADTAAVLAAGNAAALFRLCFVLPVGYPEQRGPHLHEVIGPFSEHHALVQARPRRSRCLWVLGRAASAQAATFDLLQGLRAHLVDEAAALLGSPMVHQLTEAAKAWLCAHVTAASLRDPRGSVRTPAAAVALVEADDDEEGADSTLPLDIQEALRVRCKADGTAGTTSLTTDTARAAEQVVGEGRGRRDAAAAGDRARRATVC